MRRNRIAVLFFILYILFTAGSNDARSAENEETKQVTCTGKVVDEQGRPIVGATVSLHEMVYDEATYTYDPNLLGEVQTKTNGTFSFEETIKENQYQYGYIIADKKGLALGFDNWRMRDGDKELQIKLGSPKELAGIVVDEDGNAVPDAQVTVSMLARGEGRERPTLSGFVAKKLLMTNTDETGRFVFTRIPAGATAEFIIEKAGKAMLSTYKRSGSPYERYSFAEGQKDIKLVLPLEAKIEGVVVDQTTGKPVKDVKISCTSDNLAGYFRSKPVVSQEDGSFRVDALVPDRYVLKLVQSKDELPEWTAEPVEVITETGKTQSDIKMELSKGGILEVVLKDAVSKEAVERASVGLRHETSGRYISSSSGKDGIVRMRLMPGDYQINHIYKPGYSRQMYQDSVTIQDSKIERLEYELAGMPKINGVVRDEKGEVLEGVKLKICPRGGRDDVTTDAEGKFEMTYDPAGWVGSRNAIMYLVCRHEERNLAAAMQLDEDTRVLDVKLKPGVTFVGKVMDPNGKGIKGATPNVYLRASNWGSSIGREFPVTDEQGRFEITAIPAENTYNIYTRAEGFGEVRTEIDTLNAADNCRDFGTITLPVADLSVSGIVVDDDGKPVAGANINSFGDNQQHRFTQTDVDGSFTLDQICAGKIRISGYKSGATRLSGSTETEGGATGVRIVISERPTSTRYEPRRPPSLVGRPLPELKKVGIDLPSADIDGKMLLVCFFDMEQRPSRHCLTQLVKQAEQLKGKGVTIVAVQASKIDQEDLNQWVKKYNIPFPVGMVQNDEKKTRFNWGVKSLPWLILTDREHIVRAEGFAFAELDAKIKVATEKK